MDIRARSISFTTRPRRPYGPPDHDRQHLDSIEAWTKPLGGFWVKKRLIASRPLATRRVNGLAIFYKSVALLLIRLQ